MRDRTTGRLDPDQCRAGSLFWMKIGFSIARGIAP
jgi:hypothetical protein